MKDNFDGYRSEIAYILAYHRVMSPAHLRLACLNCSVPFPKKNPLRYLELGCGNGVSLNIHAAASPGLYWGVDINPLHMMFAQKIATDAHLNTNLLQMSFSDLLTNNRISDFDVIAMHGVWSWISDAQRNAIVKLLKKKLARGGVFYISYNASPGRSSVVPLQHLLYLYSQSKSGNLNILERVNSSIAFAKNLKRAGAIYFRANPKASKVLSDLQEKNRSYLVHEYFNRTWKVSSFAETHQILKSAGLQFAASANLAEHYHDPNISQRGAALLASLEDPILRETARDFLRNQEFRQDIFVKPTKSTEKESRGLIVRARIMLLVHEVEIPERIGSPHGPIYLSHPVFKTVLSILAANNFSIKTIDEIVRHCPSDKSAEQEILKSIMVLIDAGIIAPVESDDRIKNATAACQRLNEEIILRAEEIDYIPALASPTIGAGVRISRLRLLLMAAYCAGGRSPDTWADFVWRKRRDLGAAEIMRESLLFKLTLPIYFNLRLLPAIF